MGDSRKDDLVIACAVIAAIAGLISFWLVIFLWSYHWLLVFSITILALELREWGMRRVRNAKAMRPGKRARLMALVDTAGLSYAIPVLFIVLALERDSWRQVSVTDALIGACSIALPVLWYVRALRHYRRVFAGEDAANGRT